MVLADAMARACEDGPDYLVETSTLTGGQVVALGKRIAGVMGNDDACRASVVKAAGDRSASRPGRCRCPTRSARSMESDVADICRSARAWSAPATCCRAACSCASSSPRASRGRTSTSPARRSTPARPPATGPRAAPASPSRTLLALRSSDIAARLTGRAGPSARCWRRTSPLACDSAGRGPGRGASTRSRHGARALVACCVELAHMSSTRGAVFGAGRCRPRRGVTCPRGATSTPPAVAIVAGQRRLRRRSL